MTREYKDWELCALNMSGIHTWSIVKTAPEKKGKRQGEMVVCNRCGTQPPTVHRARLYNEIKAALDLDKKQRYMVNLWRKATGR